MQTRGRFRFFLSAACGNLASAIESPRGREQSGLRGDFKASLSYMSDYFRRKA